MYRFLLTCTLFLLHAQALGAQPVVQIGDFEVRGAAESPEAVWFAGDGLYKSVDGLKLQRVLSRTLTDVIYTGDDLLVLAEDRRVYRVDLESDQLDADPVTEEPIRRMLRHGKERSVLLQAVNDVLLYSNGRVRDSFQSLSLLEMQPRQPVWAVNDEVLLRFQGNRFRPGGQFVPVAELSEQGSALTGFIGIQESKFFLSESYPSLQIFTLEGNKLKKIFDAPHISPSGSGVADGSAWLLIGGILFRMVYADGDEELRLDPEQDFADSRVVASVVDSAVILTADAVLLKRPGDEIFRTIRQFKHGEGFFFDGDGVIETEKGNFLWGEKGVYRLWVNSPVHIDYNLREIFAHWYLRDETIVVKSVHYEGEVIKSENHEDLPLKDPLHFGVFASRRERDRFLDNDCQSSLPANDENGGRIGKVGSGNNICMRVSETIVECKVPSLKWEVFIGACDDYHRLRAIDADPVWKLTGIPFWVLVSVLFIPSSIFILSWFPMPLWLQYFWYGTLFVLFALFPKVFRKFVFLTLTRMRRVLRNIYAEKWSKVHERGKLRSRARYHPYSLLLWIYRWLLGLLDLRATMRRCCLGLLRLVQRRVPVKMIRSSLNDLWRLLARVLPVARTMHPLASRGILESLRQGGEVDITTRIHTRGVTLEQVAHEVARHYTRDKWFWEAVPVVCHFENLPESDDPGLLRVIEDTAVGSVDSVLWFFNREFCKELLLQGKFVFFFYYSSNNDCALNAIRQYFSGFGDEACLVLCEK